MCTCASVKIMKDKSDREYRGARSVHTPKATSEEPHFERDG